MKTMLQTVAVVSLVAVSALLASGWVATVAVSYGGWVLIDSLGGEEE